MKFAVLFFCVFFLYLLRFHKADIPTHCLTSQIHGKWIFKSTPTQDYSSLKSLYTLKCGIKDHTSVTSIMNQEYPDNKFTDNFEIELNRDMTAILTKQSDKFVIKIYNFYFIYIFYLIFLDRKMDNGL